MTMPLSSPVEELRTFMTNLETLLSDVVASPSGLVPDDLVSELERAWARVQPLFSELSAALEAVDPAELEAAGLAGDELSMKTKAVDLSFSWFRNGWDAVGRAAPAVAGALGTGLGFADIILRSLPIAKPTERIEEFKSIVEKGAEALAYVIGPERDRPSQAAE